MLRPWVHCCQIKHRKVVSAIKTPQQLQPTNTHKDKKSLHSTSCKQTVDMSCNQSATGKNHCSTSLLLYLHSASHAFNKVLRSLSNKISAGSFFGSAAGRSTMSCSTRLCSHLLAMELHQVCVWFVSLRFIPNFIALFYIFTVKTAKTLTLSCVTHTPWHAGFLSHSSGLLRHLNKTESSLLLLVTPALFLLWQVKKGSCEKDQLPTVCTCTHRCEKLVPRC